MKKRIRRTILYSSNTIYIIQTMCINKLVSMRPTTVIVGAILFAHSFIFISCNRANDRDLDKALELAGANRSELEAVLEHYRDDSLKLEAARFLIRNMPYHFSMEEYYLSPDGQKYRPDISLFKDEKEVRNHCDSLIRHGYRPVQLKLPDIATLDHQYLINNIELAFTVWQKPWARDIPFRDFCRYVLPYRAQIERISQLRAEVMERFIPLLDSANVSTPLEACSVLNEYLKDIMHYRDTGLPFYPSVEETYRAGISRCEGLCNLGTFIMRAVGIPVAVDLTTWVKMDLGHSWCAVLDNGRFYSFGPGEDQPDVHAKLFSEIRNRRPAKVYRTRFDPIDFNRYKNDDGYVTALKSPLIYDVTDEYLDTPISIEIMADEKESNFKKRSQQIYLCVYNFYEWKPIAVGSRTDSGCTFEKVVGDNIFMVADSPDGKTLRFITAPFYVNKNGDTHKFIPDMGKNRSFTLEKRKNKKEVEHTLKYWDIQDNSFVPIPYAGITDSTQTYDQIPENALLWFTIPERIVNQRIFFIEDGGIRWY